MAAPKITQIELVIFEHEIQDMGRDYNGFNLVYEKGSVLKSQPGIIRIHTSEGIVGEYMGGRAAVAGQMASYLIGKNPFEELLVFRVAMGSWTRADPEIDITGSLPSIGNRPQVWNPTRVPGCGIVLGDAPAAL